MSFVKRYTNFVFKFRFLILMVWIIVAGGGGFLLVKFVENTTNVFNAPDSSIAHTADIALQESFPNFAANSAEFILFIYTTDNSSSIFSEELKKFSLAFNQTARNYNGIDYINEIQGFYFSLALGLPAQVASSFVSKSNRSMIIAIQADIVTTKKFAVTFAQFLEAQVNLLWKNHSKVEMQLIGIPAFIPYIQSSAELDMAVMDSFVCLFIQSFYKLVSHFLTNF